MLESSFWGRSRGRRGEQESVQPESSRRVPRETQVICRTLSHEFQRVKKRSGNFPNWRLCNRQKGNANRENEWKSLVKWQFRRHLAGRGKALYRCLCYQTTARL